MGKRYTIPKEFVFSDCLVTPSVYEGVLQRFEKFVFPFIDHLHARTQQQKALDDMKGLLSDTERKNVESISCFHGYDRQRLQIFIGQSDWDDELILDKLAKHIAKQIGEKDGVLILNPTSFPKKGKESVGHLPCRRWYCRTVADNPLMIFAGVDERNNVTRTTGRRSLLRSSVLTLVDDSFCRMCGLKTNRDATRRAFPSNIK